jgi:hypothetical protein
MFNEDPRLSVPSVAIPFGQRYIEIDLAEQTELVNYYPRGAGTWASPGGAVAASASPVRTIELYINNIFVNPDVHDVFIKRIGFTLIRVHRQQIVSCNTATGSALLQQLKWPIESLTIGMKLKDYNSADATLRATHLDKWHAFTQVNNTSRADAGFNSLKVLTMTQGTIASATLSAAGVLTGVATAFDTEVAVGDSIIVSTSAASFTYSVAIVTSATVIQFSAELCTARTATEIVSIGLLKATPRTSTIAVKVPLVNTISIKVHGTSYYTDFPVAFFNAYIPYHYGGTNISSPSDSGLMFIPFCLYPGSYQPSGHLNLSRAREFYLEWASSVISSSVEGLFHVSASAINFLLISDGSAVLRYST